MKKSIFPFVRPHLKTQEILNTNVFHEGFGMVVYSVVVGIIVAIIAGMYELSFHELSKFWHQHNIFFNDSPNWLRVAIGLLICCPILYFFLSKIPEKRQHNPADIIAGIHINNGTIDANSSILTVIASIFSIGFGFSVGYYGPTVQLGAGVGFLLHRFKTISPNHYYISIGAGAAAAIAAIFHSPIGAVVFVHEVLFRFFSIRAFAPITIAAVVSYIVSSKVFDKSIFFNVSEHFSPDILVYSVAAISAFIAAIVGIMMINSITKLQEINKKHKRGLFQQLLIGACLTALIISFIPESAGSSLNAMQDVITDARFGIWALLLIFIAKLLATTFAFGFSAPGGFLGPTIFIGAALGGLIASIITEYYPLFIASEQIIIITTMAAMISSVIGAPIAMTLIIVEVTGDFQIISAVMLAVVIANITAYRFMGCSSLFDIQLKSRGFDFENSQEQLYAENQTVSDIISDNYLTIHCDTQLLQAEQIMLQNHKDIAYVIDDDRNLIGSTSIIDIQYYRREVDVDAGSEAKITITTKTNIPVIYRASSIWQALQEMTDNGHNMIPVVDGKTNLKLLGVIHNSDVISRYLSFIHKLQKQKNAVQ
ncbi:MAG: chloride channel protein [Gammaproteobacteria bacterium]|nr:chloride channel protein [Gammaproteobacteria bacterium]